MKRIVRILILTGIAGALAFLRIPHTELDTVAAQTAKSITMTRIYTGADGLSHAEELEMNLTNNATAMMQANGVQFARIPPTTSHTWHTAPRRQLVITLSGRAEVELSGGQKMVSGPGHIELVEDTIGKGHITRIPGPEDRTVVLIPLASPPSGR